MLVQELIVPADRAAALEPYRDKNGAVDLERVLQEGKLTGLLPAGRSYGAILDPLLGKYLGQKNLESRHAQSNSIYGILQMLNARRADFTIAYPTEVTYEYRLRNSGGQLGEKSASGEFASFRIAGMPEFVNGYAMGPKTPWGEKVIGEIDAAIRRLRFKPEFVRPTLEWNEGDARRRLEQLYRNAREQEMRKP